MSVLARLSLRGRFLGLVLFGVVLPLGLAGFWLIRSSQRTGTELVRTRLAESLEEMVEAFGRQWSRNQSELLNLAEAEAVRSALRGESAWPPRDSASRADLVRLWGAVSGFAWLVEISDNEGRPVARFPDELGEPRSIGSPPPGFLNYEIAAREPFSGERLGTLSVRFRSDALVSTTGSATRLSGSVLAILDQRSGSFLTPLPVDPELFAQERFTWGDEEWMTLGRDVVDPPLRFTLAAPLGPVTAPLAEAERRGTVALLLVIAVAFALATLFIHRITRSLGGLSSAAAAVAGGDLEAHAPEVGPPEVRETARAFNSMSGALRRTLDRLSQREALAAVGEFAASLAHEVRNPLTSIRMDVERSARRLETDPEAARALAERALEEIDRLNASVTDFLRVARSGRVVLGPIDLRAPLEAAVRAAAPRFAEKGCDLEFTPPGHPVGVHGDQGALEQLVLNLLLNAGDAVTAGVRAGIGVEASGAEVAVSVWDQGSGIPEADRDRIFEPFYTTKERGTGLGLAIARRIARAHGSDLELDSAPGRGSTFRFRLQRSTGGADRIVTARPSGGHGPLP